jgi:hypothetical protein
MSINKPDVNDIYLRPDGTIFQVVGICHEPYVIMKNVATGEKISGGQSGLMWQGFERLVPESKLSNDGKPE